MNTGCSGEATSAMVSAILVVGGEWERADACTRVPKQASWPTGKEHTYLICSLPADNAATN